MRTTLKALALSLGILGTASLGLADSPTAVNEGTQTPGSMMQGDGMKGPDGMSGMMGMMQMMQQMEPMMKRCNEMMSAMTEHMKSTPQGPEASEKKG